MSEMATSKAVRTARKINQRIDGARAVVTLSERGGVSLRLRGIDYMPEEFRDLVNHDTFTVQNDVFSGGVRAYDY